MNILYFGENIESSNSFHRASALQRLGHKVEVHNPSNLIKELYSLINKFHYYTGYQFLQLRIKKWLLKLSPLIKPDLIWVNSGEYFSPTCIKVLREYNCPIILYNNDDPTGGRDGNRFNSLIKTIPYYDLCIVMRDVNIQEYYSKGAKSVLKITMSYDENIHQPYRSRSEIPERFKSDIAFIGTWMRHEKRDEFLLELIKKNIPISIWGRRWNKSPHWNRLKKYYKGDNLEGRDYVAAIQGAKICLGLLSKGNRDLYTGRTFEIPYAGGLLCAERTSEHMKLYKEGVEAVFWKDANECATICKKLLANESLRESICLAGMKRIRELQVGHEDICKTILEAIRKK